MIQKGPPAALFLLASLNTIPASHSPWLLERLTASATKKFPSAVTPRSTIKWPLVVKCPGSTMATTSFPSARASMTFCLSPFPAPSAAKPKLAAPSGIRVR